MSIRVRLFLLFALPIAPLLVNDAAELRSEHAASLASAQDRAIELARAGADRQAELISEVKTLLNVFAHVAEVMNGNADQCRTFLIGATREKPWLKGLWVADTDGEVVCSTVPGGVGLNMASRSYFAQALSEKKFVVEHYILGATRGVPAVIAAAPITEPGKTQTKKIILVSIDLAWLTKITDELSQTAGAVVLLVDEHGTILSRTPDLHNFTGRNFADHPLVKAMNANLQGNLELADLDGRVRIFGFARLPGTKARLAVGLPRDEILADVDRHLWNSIYKLLAICGIGLVAAWFGGEALVVNPIRELAGMAARFGTGDFASRPQPVARRGEFSLLATALHDMAGQIETRERGLRNTARQMASLAEMDALTGLANRRSFDTSLAAAVRRPVESGNGPASVAVLLIDVDYFKRLNDRLGHLAGDRALKRVATTLQTIVAPEGSLAARFGGEEFAVVLPGITEASARSIAERIRAEIADLHISNPDAPAEFLTVSIGLAVEPVSEQPDAIVQKADAALYNAKRLGRNCVVSSRRRATSAAGDQRRVFPKLLSLPQLRDHLQHLVEHARSEPAQLALLYIDLHEPAAQENSENGGGSDSLAYLAERLTDLVRDAGSVAYIGGSRFAVLHGGIRTQGDLRMLCEHLLERLAQPSVRALSRRRVDIGACLVQEAAATKAVFDHADLALASASAEQKSSYRIFTPEADQPFEGRLQLERDLRQALEIGIGLRLVYQPIFSADGQTMTGVEALTRWDHPSRGSVSPAIFIPVAEESGLIDQLGEWVLRTACSTGAKWPLQTIALNVSPAQFHRPGFVDQVLAVVAETGMEPTKLELEITESMVLNDTEMTRRSMEMLRRAGIRIALDDFGTGFSSLSCLTRFPIDRIKIDRSFVQALEGVPGSGTVTAAMVNLAQTMGIAVTAEGVETREQQMFLFSIGCGEVQGYYFSHPLAPHAIETMLRTRAELRAKDGAERTQAA